MAKANVRVVNTEMELVNEGSETSFTNTISTSARDFLADADGAVTLEKNARYLQWKLTGANVRYTVDGSTPSATNGYQLATGDSGVWSRNYAESVKAIREGGTDGVFYVIQCNYNQRF